jgi:hypothetical protein
MMPSLCGNSVCYLSRALNKEKKFPVFLCLEGVLDNITQDLWRAQSGQILSETFLCVILTPYANP